MQHGKHGKNAWPELVGKNGDYAASVIESENTRVDAVVILDGTPVTADFRCDRVRVRVDGNRKTTWPELVGTNGDYAATVIKGDNPSLNVAVFVNGAFVSGDLRCDRVRVWVDGNRIVVKVPTAG
ncbi:unnamed protein product [Microthlaspi erraticum]|uniref:Uncharacterized protein n=1 Tax=Microthlaspi erraticum TaxID=1685480 RepID=A0A6D2KG19_9BRAS|nr:unnamed protein product [Microthlaspi erraticum]